MLSSYIIIDLCYSLTLWFTKHFLASTTIPLIEIQIGQDVCIVTVDIHVSSALLLEGPQAKEAN